MQQPLIYNALEPDVYNTVDNNEGNNTMGIWLIVFGALTICGCIYWVNRPTYRDKKQNVNKRL